MAYNLNRRLEKMEANLFERNILVQKAIEGKQKISLERRVELIKKILATPPTDRSEAGKKVVSLLETVVGRLERN